jgi:ParB family chromosome partitioning protein
VTAVAQIPLAKIERNPSQPRETFPDDHIERLAASIKTRGLIQPITVRPVGKRFQIVAGECRFRAHQLIGAKTIDAIVADIDAAEMQLRAIVENLQRRDMNPMEEARAFKTLLDTGYTLQKVVDELGLRSPAIVRQRLDLLDLGEDIQHLVATGNLSVNMAWGVALAPREHQARLLRDIASGKLRTSDSVKAAGMALRDAAAQQDAFADLPKPSRADRAALTWLEQKISRIAEMVQAGFSEGECTAAQRVSPDRVVRMADMLALIRKHVADMERDLRRVAMQTELKMEQSE